MNPVKLLQGVSDDLKPLFKAAVKALRLEVPHTHKVAKTDQWKDGGVEECPMHGGELDWGTSGSAEKGREVKQGGLTLKKAPEQKRSCIDYRKDVCTGVYKAHKPKLMMLGFSELQAYSAQ